ncbi:M20/M25/M40 family metallo-hydrolase [Lacrimispora sp.]|uniref:M20/M25/M40 family metallo-hydrolase n=1 Tax=Lacrimispora sp. TaxID=2719234 RepID=UPI0028AF8781|nr:M20/M25/M40 family metallo-hydrolase [Lacrimispora sp.]
MKIKKQTLTDSLEKQKQELKELGRTLFACPEVGFREEKTSAHLLSFFQKNGISCQGNQSLTGVRADIGERNGSGYHIALVADMDAVYAGNGDKKQAIHACGHSIQVADMAFSMKLIKESGLLDETGGSVTFIAAPAEEFIDLDYREALVQAGKVRFFSGKQNLIADGFFDDLDCVLSAHVNSEVHTLFDIGSSLTGFTKKRIIFTGQAAHSGALAHQGRNAMHGAALFINALSFLKEQFPPEKGIHIAPVITACSGSVNTVPDQAVLETYIRANSLSSLLEACQSLDSCANHCALALKLKSSIENQTGYMPLQQSEPLLKVVFQNMLNVCPSEQVLKNPVSGASGDIGDLSYLIPSVQFGFSGIEGQIHSANFTIHDEENVYTNVVKVVLGTIYDLLTKKELQIKYDDYDIRKNAYLTDWLGI